MSTLNIFQIGLEIWGGLICMIAGMLSGNMAHKVGGTMKCGWLMVMVDALMLICDAIAYVFLGDTRKFGIIMSRIGNFGLYLTEGILALLCVVMVYQLIEEEKSFFEAVWVKVCMVLIGLQLTGILVTPFIHFYYSFGEANDYQREGGVYLAFLSLLAVCVISVVKLRQNRKKISTDIWRSLKLTFLIIFMCIIVQMASYGFSLVNIGVTIGILLLYETLRCDLHFRENEEQIVVLEDTIQKLLEQQKNNR